MSSQAAADVQAEELCTALLKAENETAVIDILKEAGLWEDESVWRAVGDMENNWSTIGNQQRSADAALVEKVINGLDAILTRRCFERGIDPESSDAPTGMAEAAERFFDIREGRLENLAAKQRTELGEQCTLVAVGEKGVPSYMIVDKGEGQTPDRFPDTFCSLGKSNKLRIPFVQGKYNSGGTGVLPWCGKENLQLIISRRAPDIPPTRAQDGSRDMWGFTVMRRLPAAHGRRSSMYVYLAPEAQVLRFEKSAIDALPGPHPEAYGSPLAAGTIVKLYNYQLKGGLKSLATFELRYAFESRLHYLCLPFRISERRDYRAHSFDTTVSGLSVYVTDSNDLEPGFDPPPGGSIRIESIGTLPYEIVALKSGRSDKSRRRLKGGVYFTVNGQVHGTISQRFIGETVGFGYIRKDVMIAVDTTGIDQRAREDLFMASRDRTRDCEALDTIRDELKRELKQHPGLRELEARRRAARIREKTDETEALQILGDLVQADPALRDILAPGTRVHDPYDPGMNEEEWQGRQFPTFFRIKEEPSSGLQKQCPVNSYCRVEFETDATNDYFTRGEMPGHFAIQGADGTISRTWNGVSTGTFQVPEGMAPGQQHEVTVTVTDEQRVEPFVNTFTMAARPPSEKSKNPSGRRRSTTARLELPPVREVTRDEWGEHDFDKYSGVRTVRSEDHFDLYVNMDNAYLAQELRRVRESESELTRYWFKWGLALLVLGMLHQAGIDIRNTSQESASEDERDVFDKIAQASRGMSTVIVPVVRQLAKVDE